MDMKFAKTMAKMMMLILLLLYVVNETHASSHFSLHLEAKSGLVYVDKFGGVHGGGGFHGGGGGHVGGGGEGGHVGGGDGKGRNRGGANIPGLTAGSHPRTQTHGRGSNNGSPLMTASLLRLASTMSGLVVLLCFA